MSLNEFYIFKSERLGFRDWLESDIDKLASINIDTQVMKFFPGTQSMGITRQFVKRMQDLLRERGFCYFAVEELNTKEFIGFIGLSIQRFEADFTPCVDIGWRLDARQWYKGFATEGAKRCITYAFKDLKLKSINAIAPKINVPSINVMQKIGMKEVKIFNHPLLESNERLRECVLYEILNDE
jgi:RimJ/RimL family protein N-acetyltransferase